MCVVCVGGGGGGTLVMSNDRYNVVYVVIVWCGHCDVMNWREGCLEVSPLVQWSEMILGGGSKAHGSTSIDA